MYNLPEDWGDYYQTCTQCMGRYHASGTVECYCKPCAKCGDLIYPERSDHQNGQCDDCHRDGLDDDDDEQSKAPLAGQVAGGARCLSGEERRG